MGGRDLQYWLGSAWPSLGLVVLLLFRSTEISNDMFFISLHFVPSKMIQRLFGIFQERIRIMNQVR